MLAPADTEPSEFESLFLGNVEFVWMVSPSIALPNATVTPSMLHEWPVVTLSEQSFHYNAVNKWFRQNGAKCERVITCNSLGVLILLIQKGMGIGLVPVSCVGSLIKERKLRILDTDPKTSPVPFFAITPLDAPMPLAERIAHIALDVSDFEDVQLYAICAPA